MIHVRRVERGDVVGLRPVGHARRVAHLCTKDASGRDAGQVSLGRLGASMQDPARARAGCGQRTGTSLRARDVPGECLRDLDGRGTRLGHWGLLLHVTETRFACGRRRCRPGLGLTRRGALTRGAHRPTDAIEATVDRQHSARMEQKQQRRHSQAGRTELALGASPSRGGAGEAVAGRGVGLGCASRGPAESSAVRPTRCLARSCCAGLRVRP